MKKLQFVSFEQSSIQFLYPAIPESKNVVLSH